MWPVYYKYTVKQFLDVYVIISQWRVAMIGGKTGRSERSDLSKTERSAAPSS